MGKRVLLAFLASLTLIQIKSHFWGEMYRINGTLKDAPKKNFTFKKKILGYTSTSTFVYYAKNHIVKKLKKYRYNTRSLFIKLSHFLLANISLSFFYFLPSWGVKVKKLVKYLWCSGLIITLGKALYGKKWAQKQAHRVT